MSRTTFAAIVVLVLAAPLALQFASASHTVTLQNGGVGHGFTSEMLAGKVFPYAPPGTVTEVCAYVPALGGPVSFAITERFSAYEPVAHGLIPPRLSDGWSCMSGLAIPWSGAGLFVYKSSPVGSVSYRRVWTGGDTVLGIPQWHEDPYTQLGYRVKIVVPDGAVWIENGGVGDGFDSLSESGKLFQKAQVPSGVLRSVCAYLEGGSGDLSVAVARQYQAHDPFAVVTGFVAGADDGWVCVDSALSWPADDGLLLYRVGGTARVSYSYIATDGDSYYRDAQRNWHYEPELLRGYKVLLEH